MFVLKKQIDNGIFDLLFTNEKIDLIMSSMYTINFTLSVTNFEPNWQEWTEILNLSQIVDQNNTCIYLFHNFCQK